MDCRWLLFLGIGTAVAVTGCDRPLTPDHVFEALGQRYLDEFGQHSPIEATALGDHRYDGELDDLSPAGRARSESFHQRYLDELAGIDRGALSRANKVDARLLEHELEYRIWQLLVLEEWSWNPLLYIRLAGDSIYSLMAREFSPYPERLRHAADRLDKLPTLFSQARNNLRAERVPQIHAETAVKQNPGIVSILHAMVVPHLGELEQTDRERLEDAIETARAAIAAQQRWLEHELLPNATGDFRLGEALYDQKLNFDLQSPLSRQEIRARAEQELRRVREEMGQIARAVLVEHGQSPSVDPADTEDLQSAIRAALELAYSELPSRDELVSVVRESLDLTTQFVRQYELITLPDDPLEIIIMPEFRRGVTLAYCDSPGPLDVGEKTFYAVSPIPTQWTDEQVLSFLREYNTRSIDDLTIHEAMPGHFVQLAYSNRYPSTLRAVLASGVFIEGWAVYAERMMVEQGWRDNDPLTRLIQLKWYLRAIANAIIDQAIHVEGMTRDEAMELMTVLTFQEEREAAAKWIRAQLTAAQLSTYFVGFQEHLDLRIEAEQQLGESFDLKRYHDTALSFGSPPVQYVRALMFGLDIE